MINEKELIEAAKECGTRKSKAFAQRLLSRKRMINILSVLLLMLACKSIFYDGQSVGDQSLLLFVIVLGHISAVYLDLLRKMLLIRALDSSEVEEKSSSE